MASNIMYSYARNQEEDFPAILTYALIGNGSFPRPHRQ